MERGVKQYYASLSALLFFFFFTWSSIFSVVAIWLRKYVGLDGADTGFIFSCISIVALCAQSLYGFIQDKLGLRKNLLLFIAVLLILSGPFFMVFGTLLKWNVFLGSVIGGLFIGMTFHAGIGVLESYTERVSRLCNFEYGKARMWGSLGWATATFFAGRNINVNPDYNFIMATVSGLLFLVILLKLKTVNTDAYNSLEHGKPSVITVKDALQLFVQPQFWALILFVFGTCIYSVYDQQFMVYFVHQFQSEQQGNEMYGYLNSLQVFLEAGGMFIAPFIVNRIGAKNGLLFASSVMALRIIGSGLADGAIMISIMKLLHAVELPILLVAIFKYNSLHFDKRLSSTLYLVGFSCMSSVVASLFSPLAGWGYDKIGFAHTYLVMGTFVIITTILSAFCLRGDGAGDPEIKGQDQINKFYEGHSENLDVKV
ncbi:MULTISPECIES: MFS transporter [Providencia]|uniref:MFS transporter n=1 Tax=Providencia huaxiensis TaxID=2027290 RepID=A0ABU2IWH1_9GAMM|nr:MULTISPECIES: MFS transporter [Providencia]MBZ3680354.1 MFS transporter [Providencia rettgeri]AXH61097.1 MFS transporter [Providencia huaxiensis]MDT0133414.1 MFS transporter [Providencia huaxiensis]MDT1979820.1 MFS transporter [Providencia huaxiensis]QLR02823.1 MFS transporter [Providencia rettgeri]